MNSEGIIGVYLERVGVGGICSIGKKSGASIDNWCEINSGGIVFGCGGGSPLGGSNLTLWGDNCIEVLLVFNCLF